MIIASSRHETWPISGTFITSHGTKAEADVVVVELKEGGHYGRGECVPYPRYGETVSSVIEQIDSVRTEITHHPDNDALQTLLPPGAARNALDCALWDLRCKQHGKRIWEFLGIVPPIPVDTALTLSNFELNELRKNAQNNATRPLLKVKLFGNNDAERIAIVRKNAPQSRIIVDANESWVAEDYKHLIDGFLEHDIDLIEQPFPAHDDGILNTLRRPINICADESCHTRSDLPELKGKYDVINIKLDKTGGLTEALALAQEAKQQGFGIMVGCMVSTSLSAAAASIITTYAAFCDLDGPLLLNEDRSNKINYEGSRMYPPDDLLWG